MIAQQISFQKILIMGKGQQRKIRGAVCNVHVNYDTICKSLPCPLSSCGFITVQQERKIEFKGHCYFQAVRPDHLKSAIVKLKDVNPLYKFVEINNVYDSEEFQREWFESDDTNNGRNIENQSHDSRNNESNENIEEEDPLNEYRTMMNESCLQSESPQYPLVNGFNSANDILSIAPGQNKHPVSLMVDECSEELSFPTLFRTGQFGFNAVRDIPLSVSQYVNS